MAWEISQKFTINQDADRAPFVDQSQSSNRYLGRNTKSISSVTSMDMYAWFKRLKTGQYYLRTQDFTDPQKFTVKPKKQLESQNSHSDVQQIPIIEDTEVCISCSA